MAVNARVRVIDAALQPCHALLLEVKAHLQRNE